MKTNKTFPITKVQFIGTGSYLPRKRETQEDFINKGVTQEMIDGWGVYEHRVMGKNETVTDMEAQAATIAIKDAGLEPKDIDLIISGTGMPMQIGVPNSTALQHKLGAKRAASFDIALACASSIPQIVVASQFLAARQYKYILLTGSSHLTRICDPSDPASVVVLGDGAGAVVVTQTDENRGILSYDMQSRGEYFDYCGTKTRRPKNDYSDREYYDPPKDKLYFYIEDPENTSSGIGKYLLTSVPNTVKKALAKVKMTSNDANFVISHQNIHGLVGKWMKMLGVNEDRTHLTYSKYGNMSAANIFVNLDEAVRMNKIKDGDIVVFAGQGAGFSVGSIVMRW